MELFCLVFDLYCKALVFWCELFWTKKDEESYLELSMVDKIETYQSSVIQHGKQSDRVYLMKLKEDNYSSVISYAEKLAQDNNYTKIVAKIPENLKNVFLSKGYKNEAFVENFFSGEKNLHFMSKFFSKQRELIQNKNELKNVQQKSILKIENKFVSDSPNNFEIRKLENSDIKAMIEVYKKVFSTYPFPIFDVEYLRKTMEKNILYIGAFSVEKLVALASAEMDFEHKNAEMTDFATLFEYRGNNLSFLLLKELEKEIKKIDIITCYATARANSIPMNLTFSKSGYIFGGRLVNNTGICGNIETMNVWYKNLF